MSRTRESWFQKSAQQGVFMKVANLPATIASGPVQVIMSKAKPQEGFQGFQGKHIVVGKSIIGGKEVVGG